MGWSANRARPANLGERSLSPETEREPVSSIFIPSCVRQRSRRSSTGIVIFFVFVWSSSLVSPHFLLARYLLLVPRSMFPSFCSKLSIKSCVAFGSSPLAPLPVCLLALGSSSSSSQSSGNFRSGALAEFLANILAGVYEPLDVNSGSDTHPVQHVDDVFGGDITAGSFGVGATTETCHRGVDNRYTHLEMKPSMKTRRSCCRYSTS